MRASKVLVLLVGAFAFLFAGGSGGGRDGGGVPGETGDVFPEVVNASIGGNLAAFHPDIVMRDRLGNALAPDSAEPYSPRKTCGACHDVDHIANGYHFQQGRTDTRGNIVTEADYFEDGRFFIQSAGMYGKW